MGKDKLWFKHDRGARNDPKLQRVLLKLGAAGKGVYWDIIETLYEAGGSLPVADCDVFAGACRVDESVVYSLIHDFKLFIIKDGFFSSERVNIGLAESNTKSEAARQSAQKRWDKSEQNQPENAQNPVENDSRNDANAMRTHCENDADAMRIECENRDIRYKSIDIENKEIEKDSKGAEIPAPPANEPTAVSVPKPNKTDQYKLREKMFYKQLAGYVKSGTYTKEMIRAFYDYWSEPNKSKTKMKWEMQQTWDVARRLSTWEQRDQKFKTKPDTAKNQPSNPIEEQIKKARQNTLK